MNPATVNASDLDTADDLPRYRGDVEVPLLAFRQALTAIKPHAAGTKGLPELQIVRIIPGPNHCHIVATDQYTAALAAVPTSDITMEELDPIDLHVDDVAKVLAVFKMPADKDLWPDCVVRLAPRGNDLSITDAGGLFDGQELIVPAHSQDHYPDLPLMLGKHLATARTLAYPPAEDRALPAGSVAKLNAAVKAYDDAAYLQAVSADPKASFLVLVTDRFLGLITPSTPPDDVEGGSAADWSPVRWRADWAKALPREQS